MNIWRTSSSPLWHNWRSHCHHSWLIWSRYCILNKNKKNRRNATSRVIDHLQTTMHDNSTCSFIAKNSISIQFSSIYNVCFFWRIHMNALFTYCHGGVWGVYLALKLRYIYGQRIFNWEYFAMNYCISFLWIKDNNFHVFTKGILENNYTCI